MLESGKCYGAKKSDAELKDSGQWVMGMWGHIVKNMKQGGQGRPSWEEEN